MADLEQALAKLDEAATHPTPDHATGYANLTRAEAIAVRSEIEEWKEAVALRQADSQRQRASVERLQRQLEEADRACELAHLMEAKAVDAVAQLGQVLEAVYLEELNGRLCRLPDGEPGTDLATREAGTCARCRMIWKQVVDALAGSVPATGTDGE